MNVAVIALGKIGLPLAVQFATKGHRVVGADISPSVVKSVNDGQPPFPGERGLDELLSDVVGRGLLSATADVEAATAGADVVVIVVPLVVDDSARPDFRALDSATSAVGGALRRGTLVSYETTLPVGTTRQRLAPALERASGLVSGEDFFVCHSPERVYSGRIFQDLRSYPKLVGGLDNLAAQLAVDFYKEVLDFDPRPDLDEPNGVWDLGSAEAAELAKLAETTYRDVNIALANEFARYADRIGVDVRQVIAACNSQPFSHIHQPGIAVGGHCIPVYPRFYLAGDSQAVLPKVARDVNESMPGYAVARLAEHLGDLSGSTVVVLGASYRGGVKETAFSGVFGVVDELKRRGATPLVHDPLYTDDELRSLGFEPFTLGSAADAAIVQSDHDVYRTLGPEHVVGAKVVIDGRRVVDPSRFETHGVRVASIGGGGDTRPAHTP